MKTPTQSIYCYTKASAKLVFYIGHHFRGRFTREFIAFVFVILVVGVVGCAISRVGVRRRSRRLLRGRGVFFRDLDECNLRASLLEARTNEEVMQWEGDAREDEAENRRKWVFDKRIDDLDVGASEREDEYAASQKMGGR